eukprot:scpid2447/ scgid12756/ Protocadherin Fat 4; Cadherin family member 14; FAT tumor suppressor homolog 4; Fat-like cadherin protein FAT-J
MALAVALPALVLLSTVSVALGSSNYFSDPAPSTLRSGERWPDVDEIVACRPIRDRIGRTSPRYTAELVSNRNSRVRFACSTCRVMSSRCDALLNTLEDSVYYRWRTSRAVEVREAWTEQEIPGRNQSLRYEGRSLSLRLRSGSSYDHTILAGLCIKAGFDWVKNYGNWVQVSSIPTTCNTSLDLAFALDASGSVGEYNFETQLTFIKNMIDFFDVSLADTRVSLVRFASYVHRQFSFTAYTSRSSLRWAVNRVGYTGGYTAIGPALQVAHTQMFVKSNGVRPLSEGVPRVLILMTDGRANVGVRPGIPAEALKRSGINIFVIGVGSRLNISELQNISSRPLSDHLYQLERFDDYAALVNRMRSVSCDEPADVPPGQNTTTEVPEDGYKYFQAKCAGLSGSVVVTIHNIVGNTHVFASTTIKNPNPWYDPRVVARDTTTGRIKSVLVKLPNSGDETVYIAIKGTDKINRFTIFITDDLFGSDEFQVSFDEEEDAGTVVTTLPAMARKGFNVQYSLPLGSQDFAINSVTGAISTLRPFDRERETSVSTVVMATDPKLACYSGRTTLIVNILDINDNAPVFEPSEYSITIDDITPVGYAFLTVTASDSDIGRNSQLSYTLTGPGANDFSIDNDGIITVASNQLSVDRIAVYQLIAVATDNGRSTLSGEASVRIALRRTNQAPEFLMQCARQNRLCRFVTEENRNVQLNLTASDPDAGRNGELSYSLKAGSSPALFQVSSDGGIVTNTGTLDYEELDEHEFVLTVSDGGTPSLSSEVKVIVTIENVNEFNPRVAPCSGSVLENAAPQQRNILTVMAEDPDPFGGLVYRLLDSADLFTLDRRNGKLSATVAFDRETLDNYEVGVIVSDSGTPQLSTTVHCSITVLDENDNVPQILDSPFEIDVNESITVGSVLLQVSATDADLGRNALLEYRLEDASQMNLFRINATTGVVTTIAPLNRELENRHNLEIIVEDNGVSSLSNKTSLTVNVLDVNDNNCVFPSGPFIASVPERSPGGIFLVNVLAVDIDLGANAEVRYRILDRGLIATIFGINETSGVVSTIGRVPSLEPEGAGPDFGMGGFSVYTINIEGFDQGNPSLTCQTTLDVHITDVPESGIMVNQTLQEVTVAENSPVGTPIAEFVPTAAREFVRPLVYTIIGGNQHRFFAVNSSTGVVFVAGNLDRESNLGNDFQLIITIRDSSTPQPLTLTVTLFVIIGDVNDNVPVFTQSEYFGSLVENEAAGQNVATVEADDLDAGRNGAITYAVLEGDGADVFYVDNRTGIVRNRVPLDRENVSQYLIKIVARDHGVPSLSSTTLVRIAVADVNDNSPQFRQLPSVISVSEDVSVPILLLTATASDTDQGTNGEVVFSVLQSTADARFFSIDRYTGQLTLVESLDRDVQELYAVTVMASDAGSPQQSTSQTITVMVVDANDNAPEFVGAPYSVSVAENTDEDTTILTFNAEDADIGVNGEVRYAMVSPILQHLPLTIDPVGGHLIVTGALDFENQTSYVLDVRACDEGIPQQCTTTTASIAITNVNEFRPTFTNLPFFPELRENAQPGTVVITLSAEDQDRDDSLTFYIISGNEDGDFAIDVQTGVVNVSGTIDFEIRRTYELIAMVQDTGNLSSIAVVTVSVLDENDNAPVFSIDQANVVTIDDIAVKKLAVLRASDVDSGVNGLVNYTLVSAVVLNDTTRLVTVRAQDNGIPTAQSTDFNITVFTTFPCDVITFLVDKESGLVTFRTLCEVLFEAHEPQNLTEGDLLRGDNVSFVCVSKSNCHDDVQYTLIKDGSFNEDSAIGGATYWVLSDVGMSDEGWYSCHASLPDAGTLFSHQLALNIKESPTITAHPETVEVQTGLSASFTCGVRGDPTPVIQWQSDGKDIPLNSRIFSGSNTTTLTVANVTAIDYGKLRCIAANRLGTAMSRTAELFGYVRSDQITVLTRVRASRKQPCPPFSLQQFKFALMQNFNLDTVAIAASTSNKCSENPCWPQPCQNGGVCSAQSGNKDFICSCPSGWIGSRCEVDRDECERNPCENDGVCINMEGTFSCDCPNNTAGQRCQLNAAACDNVNCGKKAECVLTDIRASGYACVKNSDKIKVTLKLRSGRRPASTDIAEQLTPLVLNALLKKRAQSYDASLVTAGSSTSQRRRRQTSDSDSTGDDGFAGCQIVVLDASSSSQSSDQTFDTTLVVVCPENEPSPQDDEFQSVCQEITNGGEATQCTVGNATFVEQEESQETNVQLQILILSNGTTIPVSAEEGVRLLTDPTIQAALVPLGFSIVHVQAGIPTTVPTLSATTVTSPSDAQNTPDPSPVVADGNDWLIVGVAIAGVLFVVIMFGVWLTCCWKRSGAGGRSSDFGDNSYYGVTFKRGSDISGPVPNKLSAVDTLKSRSISTLNVSSSTIFSNEAALNADYDLNASTSSRQSRKTQPSTVTVEAQDIDTMDLERLQSSASGFMVTMPNLSHISSSPYASSPLDKSPAKQSKATAITERPPGYTSDDSRYVPKPFGLAASQAQSGGNRNAPSDSSGDTYEDMASTPVGYRSHPDHLSLGATATAADVTDGTFKSKPAAAATAAAAAASGGDFSKAKLTSSASAGARSSASAAPSVQSESVEALLAELNATLKQAHQGARSGGDRHARDADESPCHRSEMHARICSDYFYDALGNEGDSTADASSYDADYQYDTLQTERRQSGHPPPPLPPRNEASNWEARSKTLPHAARLQNVMARDARNHTMDRAGSREQLMGSDSDENLLALSTGSVNYMTPI